MYFNESIVAGQENARISLLSTTITDQQPIRLTIIDNDELMFMDSDVDLRLGNAVTFFGPANTL